MTRRSIIRILLSLLLLMAQQMAMSHAMTHWSVGRGAAAPTAGAELDPDTVSSAFAQAQTCEQCLAFAQIAAAVGAPLHRIGVNVLATCAPGPVATEPGLERTTCVFQSRAPPRPA